MVAVEAASGDYRLRRACDLSIGKTPRRRCAPVATGRRPAPVRQASFSAPRWCLANRCAWSRSGSLAAADDSAGTTHGLLRLSRTGDGRRSSRSMEERAVDLRIMAGCLPEMLRGGWTRLEKP
jgi:hypothetical protein